MLIKSPVSDQDFARYYQFRWEQLRKPLLLPQGSERDDREDIAYHSMAMNSENSIIGVGRIHATSKQTMQIRYMAVDTHYQRQGVGSAILQFLLAHAVDQQASVCWLNSRSEANDFYERAGFNNLGPVKSDLDVPHFRMEITLVRS